MTHSVPELFGDAEWGPSGTDWGAKVAWLGVIHREGFSSCHPAQDVPLPLGVTGRGQTSKLLQASCSLGALGRALAGVEWGAELAWLGGVHCAGFLLMPLSVGVSAATQVYWAGPNLTYWCSPAVWGCSNQILLKGKGFMLIVTTDTRLWSSFHLYMFTTLLFNHYQLNISFLL